MIHLPNKPRRTGSGYLKRNVARTPPGPASFGQRGSSSVSALAMNLAKAAAQLSHAAPSWFRSVLLAGILQLATWAYDRQAAAIGRSGWRR
jgi:hypothetical protein